jgi:hypothetical protein
MPKIGVEQLQRIETLYNQIAAIDGGSDNDPSGFERQSTVNLLVETLGEYLQDYDFSSHPQLHAKWSEGRQALLARKRAKVTE